MRDARRVASRPALLRARGAALALAVFCCHATPDLPLVLRSRAASGAEVRWAVGEVVLEPVTPDTACGLAPEVFREVLSDEARAWNDALVACGAPRLIVREAREAGGAREDGRNVVVMLCHQWCHPDSAFGCYDATKQAITHLRPRDDD